jgi:hypothetical protein
MLVTTRNTQENTELRDITRKPIQKLKRLFQKEKKEKGVEVKASFRGNRGFGVLFGV